MVRQHTVGLALAMVAATACGGGGEQRRLRDVADVTLHQSPLQLRLTAPTP